MATLSKDARRGFWSRPGTFGIVGAFEGPNKLSWMLLAQATKRERQRIVLEPTSSRMLAL